MLYETTTPRDYPLEVRYRHVSDPVSHCWTKEMHMNWALADAERCKEILTTATAGYQVWIVNTETGEQTYI